MPVVKGDRIGESQRLNRRSVEAQDFYAHLVTSKVPDDFLRFRLQPSLIVSTMYPRREPTLALIKRVRRLLAELGEGDLPLWRIWTVDGVDFAELTTGQPRGNRYHRTPEPPWTTHEHSGACASTAIHRAKEWGNREEAERLSLFLKEIRDRNRAGAAPEHNHPSSPSSPSSPSAPSGKKPPTGVLGGRALESPPGSGNGDGRPPAPAAELIPNGHATDHGQPGEFEAPVEVVRERQRWLDHDPRRPLEVRLVLRILNLAAMQAALERREMTAADVAHVRVAVTSTKSDYPMTVIRGVKDSWIEASLRQADVFERENFGGDEPPQEE